MDRTLTVLQELQLKLSELRALINSFIDALIFQRRSLRHGSAVIAKIDFAVLQAIKQNFTLVSSLAMPLKMKFLEDLQHLDELSAVVCERALFAVQANDRQQLIAVLKDFSMPLAALLQYLASINSSYPVTII